MNIKILSPLAAALIVLGQSGDPVRGGLALFSMSLGMGAPLLVFGAYFFAISLVGFMESIAVAKVYAEIDQLELLLARVIDDQEVAIECDLTRIRRRVDEARLTEHSLVVEP